MRGSILCFIFLAAASARGAEPSTATAAGVEWVKIPGGSFKMGDDHSPVPSRRIALKDFELSRSAVTNKQYRACVAAKKCTPAKAYGPAFAGDEQPVVGVTWHQAAAFAAWSGGRLPSEPEWEYAFRSGGKDQVYPWGNERFNCERAVAYDKKLGGFGCGRGAPWPVCSKPKGHTAHGLCDMAGNVLEWVQDRAHRSHFEKAPLDGSAWEDREGEYWSSDRVVRGRSWDDEDSETVAQREWEKPSAEYDYLGFRIAR